MTKLNLINLPNFIQKAIIILNLGKKIKKSSLIFQNLYPIPIIFKSIKDMK